MTPIDNSKPLCTYLDWDSRFFNQRISRINRHRLQEPELNEALAWCAANQIDCLYMLADSDDPKTLSIAEGNGFLLTDVRLTLERPLAETVHRPHQSNPLRKAHIGDLDALKKIARVSHRDTRFYSDPHFDREKCDLLYQAWIENSFSGFADEILVVEADARVIGYITCSLKEGESQIGLAGVDHNHQGAGVGRQLMEGFLVWSAEHGAARSTVVTQGRNVRAQRLYQRCGFVTASCQLWYHRWFLDSAPHH